MGAIQNISIVNFYLNKYGFCPPSISSEPSEELGISVVIPCFNEPDLVKTLSSLKECQLPTCHVEIIVVLNSSEKSPEDVVQRNNLTKKDFDSFAKEYSKKKLKFHLIHSPNLPKKHAGVGLARKIGMDEAVQRFHEINTDGIIVCFDADSLCEPSYLVEIEKHFRKHPKTPGCSIHFEHPIDGTEHSKEIYQGIIFYELHLRYYNQCFRFCNLPYAFHTVGSSMAVRSSAYQKQGGMNKRKAGEDFYFLHKIIGLGNFTELKTTMVIPSPRVSDRVPFGTGKAIGDYIEKNHADFYTYNFETFKEIKAFVELIPDLYENGFSESASSLSSVFKAYLKDLELDSKIQEMKANTKDFESFRKRFFAWFDAFQILKLVHFMQENGLDNQPIKEAVNDLLVEYLRQKKKETELNQLLFLRDLESNEN